MLLFYTPAPFSLFLVFIAFMVWKLLLKYLEMACLYLDSRVPSGKKDSFLGRAILFTRSLLTQSSTECQRQQSQVCLILSKHTKFHVFPKPLFWWGESIKNKALQAHRWDFACVILLSMQRGYLLTGIQMTPGKPDYFHGVCQQEQKPAAAVSWGWAGAAQAWSSLQKQSLHEQLGSSELESQLRGTCLGTPSTHTEQGSGGCGKECTLEKGVQGSIPPGHFPPSSTHLVFLVPMQLPLCKFLRSKYFTPSAIQQELIKEKPLSGDRRHTEVAPWPHINVIKLFSPSLVYIYLQRLVFIITCPTPQKITAVLLW